MLKKITLLLLLCFAFTILPVTIFMPPIPNPSSLTAT